MYTKDLASLKEFDMCKIVYENLRDCIKIWKKQRQDAKNKASLTMPGCPIIILVSILMISSITSCIFGFEFFLRAQLAIIFGFFYRAWVACFIWIWCVCFTVNLFNYIFGCQGFIVDNLKLMDSVNKNRPRLNEYDMATLMDTICKANDNGRISFENFKVLIISLSW